MIKNVTAPLGSPLKGFFQKKYRPFISYTTWRMIQDGKIKNEGTSLGDLQLYSGNPMDFQGSQYIDITLPNVSNMYLIQSFDNIITTVDLSGRGGESYFIGKFNGTGTLLDGLFDFFIIRSTDYTSNEIDQANEYPNQFYNAMENDSNTLFCTDFRVNDGYIADDKNKNVDSTIIQDNGSKVSIIDDRRIAQVTKGLLFEAGKNYLISYDHEENEAIGNFRAYIPPTSMSTEEAKSWNIIVDSKFSIILKIPEEYTATNGNSSFYFWLEVDGTPTTTNFSNISVKEISGIYPITNYSSTMRTNFQNESTGLQDLMIERDSLGFFLGLRDYPKGNGVGYGDTGWILSGSEEEVSLEIIIKPKVETFYHKYLQSEPNKITIQTIPNSNTLVLYWFCGYIFFTFIEDETYVFTAVKNGSTSYLYVNGVLYATRDVLSFSSDRSINIFAEYGTHNYSPRGEIRLFKVHNKVLTQEEITKNYNKYVSKGLLS